MDKAQREEAMKLSTKEKWEKIQAHNRAQVCIPRTSYAFLLLNHAVLSRQLRVILPLITSKNFKRNHRWP